MNGARKHHGRFHRNPVSKRALEERDPSLIDLPISIASVPFLNSIVTALVGDSNNQQTTTVTTTTTATPSTSTESTKTYSTSTSTGAQSTGGNGGSPTVSSTTQTADATTTQSASATVSSTTTTSSISQVIVNAGGGPGISAARTDLAISSSGTISLITYTSTIYSNGVAVGTQVGTQTSFIAASTGTTSSTGGGSGAGTAANGSSAHGVSKGLIAGMSILGVIGLLGLFVFGLRKRSKSQQTERRKRWWRSKAADPYRFSNGTGDATCASGTLSTRSSFATTFDHGTTSGMVLDFTDGGAPPLPPAMAEIRDAHGPGLLLHSQEAPPLVSLDSETSNNRASVYSNRSASSDSHAQYLVVDPFLDQPGYSPMSVRPFTPSESFPFPKPPTTARLSSSPPASPLSDNPFSDPVETIQRAFTPTLHDEVRVVPGDSVRVSKVYDDGWALIEMSPASSGDKGKAKQVQGLIPVDCLRAQGEDLATFMAARQLNSLPAIGRPRVEV